MATRAMSNSGAILSGHVATGHRATLPLREKWQLFEHGLEFVAEVRRREYVQEKVYRVTRV